MQELVCMYASNEYMHSLWLGPISVNPLWLTQSLAEEPYITHELSR